MWTGAGFIPFTVQIFICLLSHSTLSSRCKKKRLGGVRGRQPIPMGISKEEIVANCKKFPQGEGQAFVCGNAQWKYLPQDSEDPHAVHVVPARGQGSGKGCVTFYLRGHKAVVDGGGGNAQQAGILSSLISDWTYTQ